MSRFAVVREDPDYDDDISFEEDEAYWEDRFSEWEANEGVVKEPQNEVYYGA
jgi:hypothetical protein